LVEKTSTESATLWHGRFDKSPSEALLDFTVSLSYDKKLAPYDIEASIVHTNGLHKAGIVTKEEQSKIVAALKQTGQELAAEEIEFLETDEDIHTVIERRVTELAGQAGAKLHTARSRNDQVATAFRLWTKAAIKQVIDSTIELQKVLHKEALKASGAYLPGYTHMQQAQPILLAHHFGAHAWALNRDVERLFDCLKRVDVSPLGAGALAGTSLPIDPNDNAMALGFSKVFENSLDVTSDRDFVAETLFCLTMLGVHLSRIGEEFVLWSTQEFGFATLDDQFSTGSSMLPQKKNPDIAELVRGKSGRLIGNLTGLLATLKGLPLAYNRDLQEDKEPLFDSVEQILNGLLAVSGMIATATYNTKNMAASADNPLATSTDLAEILVGDGIPFRKAHAIVGEIVRETLATDQPMIEIVKASEHFDDSALELFEPGASVKRRTSHGSAGPEAVAKQLELLNQAINSNHSTLTQLTKN